MSRFPDVPGGYPFPRLEEEVLAHWKRSDVFRQSVERTRGGPPFVFYEGPPTANNVPHVGHVVSRAVKDLFPRYRTMRGYHVERKAGWDTHGLPVEIEVEKSLGFSGKDQIEAYGIEAFNRRCLESVRTYEEQWRSMSERVGFWIDLGDPYFTFSNEYIESVWWALRRLWDRDLLAEDYKIQPYCARCGTTLSSHEVAQNYKEAEDPSVWVRFPARPGQALETLDGAPFTTPEELALVAWTTTPWTLLAHVGLAVHPELVYKAVEDPRRSGALLLFAEEIETPLPLESTGEDGRSRLLDLRERPAVARFRGASLEGLRYDRPFRIGGEVRPTTAPVFDPPPSDTAGWCVFSAPYVTAAEGTGLVHTAPPYGEDDYASGRRLGLPLYLTVTADGRIDSRPGIESFAGLWFKDADAPITRDLRQRNLLLHGARHRHSYPFCWRCDRPLLYFATQSWFVRTTRAREDLLRHNREISWHPRHVGEGRFGRWLENVVDWALSRKRYWGTPLPVWRCDRCSHTEVVGSFAELFERAGRRPPEDLYDRGQFDPHRPFVDREAPGDAFVWSCPSCEGGTVGRVEEVIDAWFDSGSMPYAQHHYMGEPLEGFDPASGHGFPADFIAEGVDQTRGWFYTLHVLGVLLFDSPAYRNCVVLGHINDEQGRKMSKRLGNVVEPMAVMRTTGADALRWYLYANNPELSARFSDRLVREAAQKFLLPLWNALSFFTIYANLDAWRPGAAEVPFARRPDLDRWILLRLDALTAATTDHLDGYRIADAARGLESFVDDLTNWYIRRSRDRFWAPSEDAAAAKESAYQTLYEILTVLARLIAPFTPFLAEVLHRHLVRSQRPDAAESVHLTTWPEPRRQASAEDETLADLMRQVQRIVRLGRAARNSHGLKTRQPLARVTVVSADPALSQRLEARGELVDLLREELNVKSIAWLGAERRQELVRHEIRPVFPRLGPRFGKDMPRIQQALAAADGDRIAHELEVLGRQSIALRLDGATTVELEREDVEVQLIEKEGLATAGDPSLLVALDTELTPELVAEGRAREIVNRIQTARKELELDYSTRIRLAYHAAPELEEAIRTHGAWIRHETLARGLHRQPSSEGLRSQPVDGLDFAFTVEPLPTSQDAPPDA